MSRTYSQLLSWFFSHFLQQSGSETLSAGCQAAVSGADIEEKLPRPWAGHVSAPGPASFPVHQCAGEANDWIQSAAWLMRGSADPGQAINHVIRANVPWKRQDTPAADRTHCIHLHLCMHAVKRCQGHHDGEQSSSPLQITLQRQETAEACVCMSVCVDK